MKSWKARRKSQRSSSWVHQTLYTLSPSDPTRSLPGCSAGLGATFNPKNPGGVIETSLSHWPAHRAKGSGRATRGQSDGTLDRQRGRDSSTAGQAAIEQSSVGIGGDRPELVGKLAGGMQVQKGHPPKTARIPIAPSAVSFSAPVPYPKDECKPRLPSLPRLLCIEQRAMGSDGPTVSVCTMSIAHGSPSERIRHASISGAPQGWTDKLPSHCLQLALLRL